MEPETIEKELEQVRKIAGVLTYARAKEYAETLEKIERYAKKYVEEFYHCSFEYWIYESDHDICITYRDNGKLKSAIVGLVELIRNAMVSTYMV